MQLSDLWTWRGTMDRARFLFWGIILGAIKYNLDRLLVWHWSGQRWSLLDYSRFGDYLWPTLPSGNGLGQWATLLALSLPFMAAGVILTLKRLRSANLPLWLVLLFFVPVIKIIFFLLLIIIPPRESSGRAAALPDIELWPGLLIPRGRGAAAVAGIGLATACSAATIWIGTTLLRNYGWTLFVGLPFSQGFLAVIIYGYHEKRSLGQCLTLSLISLAVAGGALLLIAMEGLICLVMAVPLAAPMALIGGLVAYSIQAGDYWGARQRRLLCVPVLVLVLMLVEHAQPAVTHVFSNHIGDC